MSGRPSDLQAALHEINKAWGRHDEAGIVSLTMAQTALIAAALESALEADRLAALAPVTPAGGYYLASFKQKANGGEVLWWGPDDRGYTPDLEQAGIYTEIKKGYHDSDQTVPVPVSFIEELRVRRTVDPGDSLNGMFWNAEKLRAALTPSRDQEQA